MDEWYFDDHTQKYNIVIITDFLNIKCSSVALFALFYGVLIYSSIYGQLLIFIFFTLVIKEQFVGLQILLDQTLNRVVNRLPMAIEKVLQVNLLLKKNKKKIWMDIAWELKKRHQLFTFWLEFSRIALKPAVCLLPL